MGHTFSLTETEIERVDAAFNEGAAAQSRAVRGYMTSVGLSGRARTALEVLAFVHGTVRDSEPAPKVPGVNPGYNPWIAWAVDRAREERVVWSSIAFASGQFGVDADVVEVTRGTDREELKQRSRVRPGS